MRADSIVGGTWPGLDRISTFDASETSLSGKHDDARIVGYLKSHR